MPSTTLPTGTLMPQLAFDPRKGTAARVVRDRSLFAYSASSKSFSMTSQTAKAGTLLQPTGYGRAFQTGGKGYTMVELEVPRGSKTYFYLAEENVQPVPAGTAVPQPQNASQASQQQQLDEIIRLDTLTRNKLILAQSLAEAAAGVNPGFPSARFETQIQALARSLNDRQTALKKTQGITVSSVIDGISSAAADAYSWVKRQLGIGYSPASVGLAPLLIVGLIAVGVVGGGAVVYNLVTYNQQSKVDFKVSDELIAQIQAATPQQAKELVQQSIDYVRDKNYDAGKSQTGFFGQLGKSLPLVLGGLAALFILKK